MIEKDLVAKNFSKGAKSYDKYADVQREMAKKLNEYIKKSEKEYKILEIGAGTGIFTRYILEKYPNSKLDIIDISKEMLKRCKKKYRNKSNINYILGDIETYSFTKKYDFIFSNATFQWVNDFKKVFEKLGNYLNEDGEIIFSIFGKDTYIELRKSFLLANISDNYSQSFLSQEDIVDKLSDDFKILDISSERIIEEFNNVMTFLKKIKKLGTNSANRNKSELTKKGFKKMEKVYLDRFSKKGKIIVTNHLIYCKIKVDD